MHFYSSLRAASLLGLAVLALLPGSAQAAPSYTLTGIGGYYSAGYGVNDNGQATGYTITDSNIPYVLHVFHAFRSGPNGLTDLGTLPGGRNSYGTAINDSGQVTGHSDLSNGDTHAFLYGPNGLTDLGTLFFDIGNSYGLAINKSGKVTGYSYSSGGYNHAFLSGPNGLTDLGTLTGDTDSYGNGINDSGQVVGYSYASGGNFHAFLSSSNGGSLTDLGTFPGSTSSVGKGVNNSGQVAGYANINGGGNFHAFLSGANGVGLTDLGTLPGGPDSFGNSVNDNGQVVGYSETGNTTHAFLYENGTMIDLNTLIDPSLGFTLRDASSISDTGSITGNGINSQGQTEAFLLTPTDLNPVPEASSVVSLGILLTLGMGGVLATKARRKKAA